MLEPGKTGMVDDNGWRDGIAAPGILMTQRLAEKYRKVQRTCPLRLLHHREAEAFDRRRLRPPVRPIGHAAQQAAERVEGVMRTKISHAGPVSVRAARQRSSPSRQA